MINIKQATVEDIKLLEDLYSKKIEQLAAKNIVQWTKAEVRWDILSQTYQIDEWYIVYVDTKAVGAFVVVDYDPTYWLCDKPQEALYIHKVMVLDEVEKKGVADEILTFFKALGKQRGYSEVKLDVREYKDKLRAFYERNGFVLKEIVDLHKGYLTCLYTYSLK